MKKRIIDTDQAPAAIGPYSQAVEADNTLYVSGQIAIDPETGELIDGDIQNQVQQVIENIKHILNVRDYTLKSVVKAEVFLDNMDEFDQINEVYAQYFKDEPPARVCMEVSRLPKDVGVEISVIAVK
jgi:2-iminobutanoate/2-iminopropanoate deaminase